MPPRLAAIVGPLKGSIIDLGPGCLSVGREKGNQVCIKSSAVSRRHCEIVHKDGRFKITDLESSNGTFVNDVPVQQRWLEHGDRVRIGDSIFLVSLRKGASESASHRFELRDDDVASKPLELTLDDTLSVGTFVSKYPEEGRLVRDLHALLEISAAINSIDFHERTASHWLLSDAYSPCAGSGMIGTHSRLFSPDGKLVASGNGTLICRPRPGRG